MHFRRSALLLTTAFLLLFLRASAQTTVEASTPDAPSQLARQPLTGADLSGSVLTPNPVLAPQPPKPRIFDGKFIVLGALAFGLTTADIELTQHCLHKGTCRELNPTLPDSRLGMYAVNTPVNLALFYWSYRRRASGKHNWWIAPLIDIGAHAVGIGSNIRFAY